MTDYNKEKLDSLALSVDRKREIIEPNEALEWSITRHAHVHLALQEGVTMDSPLPSALGPQILLEITGLPTVKQPNEAERTIAKHDTGEDLNTARVAEFIVKEVKAIIGRSKHVKHKQAHDLILKDTHERSTLRFSYDHLQGLDETHINMTRNLFDEIADAMPNMIARAKAAAFDDRGAALAEPDRGRHTKDQRQRRDEERQNLLGTSKF